MAVSDVVRLTVLASLWGGSFAFMRVAVPALGPLWLAWSRVGLAFVALFAMACIRGNVPKLRDRWREYLVIGSINSAAPFALYCFAEQYVTASMAAVLNATSPFFGGLIGAMWSTEALTRRKIAGMMLGMVGVVVLVGWEPSAQSAATVLAILACLAASLCYGIASVYAKARLSGVPSFSVALYSQLTAAVVLAPALPWVSMPAGITTLVAVNVLALALASTALAYLLYFRLIATIGPARSLTVTFLIPLFGVLWGVLFLDEAATASMIGGGVLILAGMWLALRDRSGSAIARQTRSASGPSTCSRNSR